MQPLIFMCPILVSRPGLPAVATSHQTSPVVSLFVVTILTTNALEQQHGYQITWCPFNQSVLFIMSEVLRVFDVADVSTPCVSSHSACNVSPSRSSLVCGIVTCAVQVHACPCVQSSTSLEPVLHIQCQLLHAHFCTQVADSECGRISPKDEHTSHGFSVSHDTVMNSRDASFS